MAVKNKAMTILNNALDVSMANETEVLLITEEKNLTRFSESNIHQNVADKNTLFSVRAVVGNRVGIDMNSSLMPGAILNTVQKAYTIATLQPENPGFKSLPSPYAEVHKVNNYYERTAEYSPLDKVNDITKIIKLAKANKLLASGILSNTTKEIAVANSHGISAYHTYTTANLTCVMSKDGTSGYADAIACDVNQLNAEEVAEESIQRCLENEHAEEVEEGDWEVILEEYAVTQLMEYLGFLAFGAGMLQDGTSYVKDKFGKKVFSEKISVWDDALDPRGVQIPFDYEGVAKQKVMLIDKGVPTGAVYDSYTAGKEGKSSTGHALPAPNTYGPLPQNMFVGEGTSTKEEMIASTKKGLLITRFHYMTIVNNLKTIVSGTTRDGVLVVENGKITKAAKNLRFTQSIAEALANVEMVSKKAKLKKGPESLLSVAAPKLKISSFHFTGKT